MQSISNTTLTQLNNNERKIHADKALPMLNKSNRSPFQLPLSYLTKEPLLTESQFFQNDISPPIINPNKSSKLSSSNKLVSDSVDEYVNEKLNINSEKAIPYNKSSRSYLKSATKNLDKSPLFKSKYSSLVLPKKCISENNKFFEISDMKTIIFENLVMEEEIFNNKLNHFQKAAHENEFNDKAFILLKDSLNSIPTSTIFSIKNRIFEFCRDSLIAHFEYYKDLNSFDEYLENESERVSLFLDVIQRSILLRDILPPFLCLKKNLADYLSLFEEKTGLTLELYFILQNLTKITTFSSANCDIIHGKDVSEFVNTIKKLFSLGDHNRDNQKVAQLIMQALGGIQKDGTKESINFEGASKLIEFLEEWSRPGNGGLSAEFQLIQDYCNKIAPLCMKISKLSEIEYHCHIDHLYSEPNSASRSLVNEVTIAISSTIDDPTRYGSPRNEQKTTSKFKEKMTNTSRTEEKLTASRMDEHSKSLSPKDEEKISHSPCKEESYSTPPSPRKMGRPLYLTKKYQRKSTINDIFPANKPKLDSTSEKSKAIFLKFSSSTPTPTPSPFFWAHDEQIAKPTYSRSGLRLSLFSYSINPVHQVIRSLKPDEEIVPN
nr:hypothetical protein [Parachlamydiaceae bacterium]